MASSRLARARAPLVAITARTSLQLRSKSTAVAPVSKTLLESLSSSAGTKDILRSSSAAAAIDSGAEKPKSLLQSARENLVRDWLNHVAGVLRAIALVQTDVLLLQSFMLGSSGFTIYRLGKDAQRTAVCYAVLFASLSAWATYKLASDRFVFLTDEESKIFDAHFADESTNLTRPMFKKLLGAGTFHEASSDVRVLTRGDLPRLVLLLDGRATISAPAGTASTSMLQEKSRLRRSESEQDSLEIVRGCGTYGEVSFVRSLATTDSDVTARANVTLSKGSRYIIWDGAVLRTLLRSDSHLSNALVAFLSLRISKKLTDTRTSVGKSERSLQDAKIQLDVAV